MTSLHEMVHALPTCQESEADIAKDAPAAIAFIHRHRFADEADLLAALGVS